MISLFMTSRKSRAFYPQHIAMACLERCTSREVPHTSLTRQMWRDLEAQQAHQGWLHKAVVVGDAQAHHPLACQIGFEARRQLGLVRLLHHEDEVGPFHQLGAQRHLGIMAQTCRGTLHARVVSKDVFSGGAAPFVFAADEQYRRQLSPSSRLCRLRPPSSCRCFRP
jgi:hypothetical protein